jgi:hypothetical protein
MLVPHLDAVSLWVPYSECLRAPRILYSHLSFITTEASVSSRGTVPTTFLLLTPNYIDFAVAWSGQLIFDAICFYLTLRKSIAIGRSGQRTLINTLLRDGRHRVYLLLNCIILDRMVYRCGVLRVRRIPVCTPFNAHRYDRIMTAANLANILTFLVC